MHWADIGDDNSLDEVVQHVVALSFSTAWVFTNVEDRFKSVLIVVRRLAFAVCRSDTLAQCRVMIW